MLRKLIWSDLTSTGLEHFYLHENEDEITADGVVLGIDETIEFRLRYRITCDTQWRVRRIFIELLNQKEHIISLTSDGSGQWTNESGELDTALNGCIDADITATPFTNTLPIRRLSLNPNESADIQVAYFTIPEMQVTVKPQRYTCLEADGSKGKYRFESLDDGFTAVLDVDADGLVMNYPDLFRCVWIS